MAVIPAWKIAHRISLEASFGASNPESKADWHIGGNGGGLNGWLDLPIMETPGVSFKRPTISPTGKGGSRGFNVALPVKGTDSIESLGDLEMPVYPELIDRALILLLSNASPTRTETAGAAALASTAFASLATLDTQPDGTEQLKFVISSSTAATGAAINIIQNGATVETVTIGTNAGTVDGTYYSKGGYDGSTNAITFSVDGTITSGMVVISGVDYSTNEHTPGTSIVTGVLEQQERAEAGSGNSEFYSGLVIPSTTFSFDRNAADGLLTASMPVHGLKETEATKTTYEGAVGKYYRPFPAWTGAVNLDGAGYAEVVSAEIVINSKNSLYNVASGNQAPTGAVTGQIEKTFSMTIVPADGSRYDDYLAGTMRSLSFDFVTSFYVVDSTGYRLLLEFEEVHIEDYTKAEVSYNDAMVQGAELTGRIQYKATDKITTRCRLPV